MDAKPSDGQGRSALHFDPARLDLPMLPTVAMEVLSLCRGEETDAARLAEVLHRDQALAGNVLRVANSAAFAPKVPIASLQQAISRMGMNQVSEIALAVTVRGKLFGAEQHAGLLERIWVHSVASGFFAKEIARLRRKNVETAFLCGLLHDVGKAVLLANLDLLCPNGEEATDPEHLDLLLEEHHPQAGAALTAAWQLPPVICEAVRWHHVPEEAEEHREGALITHLADLLANYAIPSERQVTEEEIRGCEVLVMLNIYPEELDDLLALADQAVQIAEGVA